MDDLWSIDNHDFMVEMNAHRMRFATASAKKILEALEAVKASFEKPQQSAVPSFDNVVLSGVRGVDLMFNASFFEIN
ncbi:hypothetical protein Tco_0025510 [Tanacetum coccineum]